MELLHDPTSDVVVCTNAEIRPHVPVPYTGDRFDVRPIRTPSQCRPPVHDSIMRACEGAIQRVINRFLEDGLRLEPPSSAVLGEAIDGCSRGLDGAPMWASRTEHLPAEKELMPAGIRERILSSEFDFFGQKVDLGGACESPADLMPLLPDIPGIPGGALLDSAALSRTWLAVRTAWLSDRSSSADMKAAGPLLAKRVNQDGSKKESAGCSRTSNYKRTASQTSALPPQAGLKRRRVVASGRHGAGDDEDDKDRGSYGDDAHANRPHGDEANGESRPFACPFYKLNRANYMDCINLRLTRICDVKQHLTRRHSQQPFCPTCYATFATPNIRDDHIRLRCCEASSTARTDSPKGISPEALIRLKSRNSRHLSPADRWYGIWDVVFKDEPKPPSPYLGSVLEETLGMIGAFWSQEAPRIVAAFLQGQPTQAGNTSDFGPLLMYLLSDVQSRFEQNNREPHPTCNSPLPPPVSRAAPLPRSSQENGNEWQLHDFSFEIPASPAGLIQPPSMNVVSAMEGFDWDQAHELAKPLGNDTTSLDLAPNFDDEWSRKL